jgi:hypothetical protein
MPLMSIQWRVSSCNGCGGSEKLAMTEKSWEKCSLYTRNETDKGQDSRLTAFRGNEPDRISLCFAGYQAHSAPINSRPYCI